MLVSVGDPLKDYEGAVIGHNQPTDSVEAESCETWPLQLGQMTLRRSRALVWSKKTPFPGHPAGPRAVGSGPRRRHCGGQRMPGDDMKGQMPEAMPLPSIWMASW